MYVQGVLDTTSKWFKNLQPQGTKISTVANALFIQNSNWMASSYSEHIFKVLRYSRQRPSFLAQRAALMTKTDLTFPAFSLRLVEFAVQFCFRCKFSFHERRHSSQVWQWAWFSFATHSNQSDCLICIDNRLRQMAFFRGCQSGRSGQRKAFESCGKILK